MPVSLLTPIAADLHATEGQAGQAISVSGVFAVLTSVFIATVVRRRNRKNVLLGFTALMMLSGTVVALAPDYPIFMIGRALLGVVIGGFGSMSAAASCGSFLIDRFRRRLRCSTAEALSPWCWRHLWEATSAK